MGLMWAWRGCSHAGAALLEGVCRAACGPAVIPGSTQGRAAVNRELL